MNFNHRDRIAEDLAPAANMDVANEQAIEQALAQPPTLVIPPGFAARVARLAVQQPIHARASWLGWGPRLALASGALITLGMFFLAPHSVPSLADFRFDAELVLLTELGGLLLFAHRLLPQR